MSSYYFWLSQAQRWDGCVDYASPMTAWSNRMFEILTECDNDKIKASKQLLQEKNNDQNCR